MKYFYTYRVDCTAFGWEGYYYLGQHTTSDLEDGYKGSGTKLKEYYKQHPEDYTFTILEFYSNKTELNIAEQKLISDLWKSDKFCLNNTSGGTGTWKHINSKPMSDETKKKISESNKGKIFSEEHKRKLVEAWKNRTAKPHSEETKRKISESNKNKRRSEETKKRCSAAKKGKNNPMYGKKGKRRSEDAKRKMSEVHKGKHRVYREDGTYYYTK